MTENKNPRKGKKRKAKVVEVRLPKQALKRLYWKCQDNVELHCGKMNFWIRQRNHWQDILRERYGLFA